MRRALIAAVLAVAGLAAPATAHAATTYADSVAATPGLAGWWRLGEASGTSVADRTGGAAGSIASATLGVAGAIDGDADTALRFGGAGSANLGDGPALTGPLTVETWVRPDGTRATQDLVSDGGASSGYRLVLATDGSPVIQVWTTAGMVEARGTPLAAGAWHHLAGVAGASSLTLYVDGEARATTPIAGARVASTNRLRLGRLSSSSRNYLRGSLDEVALYGAALPAATVRAHWLAGADVRAPDTAIAAAPGAASASAEATVAFGGDAVAATYQCRLDAATWAACASPVTLRGLADGAHSFAVRAVSRYGIADSGPAALAWTVDTRAPDTRALAILPSAAQSTGAVTFASTEPGSRYECRRGAGPWSPCASPLAAGAGADLAVRAVDGAGNADAQPAVLALPAPAAPAAAVSVLTGPTASFGVAGVGTGALQCSIDGAAWAGCASPLVTGPLAPGAHRVAVRSTAVGAPGAAQVDWSVALPAPRLVGFHFPILLSVPPARKIRAAGFPRSRLPALRFSLNVASSVRLTLERGRRRVRAWSIAGAAGANVYRLPLAVLRTLRSGRYRLAGHASGAAGRSAARAVRFHVVRRAR